MITVILMTLMLVGTMWINVNSNNPMKTSFFILTSAAIMFFLVKMTTKSVWMPLIFFVLFTGGILMMFMILSSVLPNEKTMKIKYSKTMIAMFTMTSLLYTKSMTMEMTSSQMKSFFSSGLNMLFMTSIILIYFFNSMNLNSKEDTPMRSLQC